MHIDVNHSSPAMFKCLSCSSTFLRVQSEQTTQQLKAGFRQSAPIKVKPPDWKFALQVRCSGGELELQEVSEKHSLLQTMIKFEQHTDKMEEDPSTLETQ